MKDESLRGILRALTSTLSGKKNAALCLLDVRLAEGELDALQLELLKRRCGCGHESGMSRADRAKDTDPAACPSEEW